MHEHRKAKMWQIILGASGTILVALFIIIVKPGIPLLFISGDAKGTLTLFLLVSSIFFFPPYFAMLGLLGLDNPEAKEGEVISRDFMSSYRSSEKSKKDWSKHLVACMVGTLNAFLMWTLNYALR